MLVVLLKAYLSPETLAHHHRTIVGGCGALGVAGVFCAPCFAVWQMEVRQ